MFFNNEQSRKNIMTLHDDHEVIEVYSAYLDKVIFKCCFIN